MTVPVVINGSTLTALARLPFVNGQAIRIQGYIAPTGLAFDTDYFIVLLSGNSFSVSLTFNGSPITAADSGSGQLAVYESVPLTWWQLKLLPLVQPSDVRRVLTTPETLLAASAGPDTFIGITVAGNVFTSGIPHGLLEWTAIQFSSTLTLPAPLVAGVTYYATALPDDVTFSVASVIGGSVITLTTAGTGQLSVQNYSLNAILAEKIVLSGEWLYDALSERIIRHLSRVGWNWWTWFYPTQPIMPSPPRRTADLVLDSLKNPEKLIHAWVAFAMWAMSIDGRWKNLVVDQMFLTQFGQSPESERKKRAMEALDDICPLLEVRGTYGQRRIFDFEQVSDSVYTSLM
jgi:hypothetical protein